MDTNNENMTPIDEDGNPKSKFEVKMLTENGSLKKRIYINEELLDWEVDVTSLMEARNMGPKFFKSVQRDIEKHFVNSVSEVLGRKVTPEDIKKAIQTGWI